VRDLNILSHLYGEGLLIHKPSPMLGTTSCLQSGTVYSTHS